jgi:hypothetical protein
MSQQNELGGGQSGGGGLPTSGAESQVGVVQDRFGNLHKKGQQYQNLLLHALSLPAVQKSLAQDGNLRMRDIAKLNMVSKEICSKQNEFRGNQPTNQTNQTNQPNQPN